MLVPNGHALDVRLLKSIPSPVADALVARGCSQAADALAMPELLQEVLKQYRVPLAEQRGQEMLAQVGREAGREASGSGWRKASSALELLQETKKSIRLPCTQLSQLLGSALSGGLLEVCGLPGSGKTQFCLPRP